MEVWILLAAAGSGYLASRWQNAQKPRDSSHACDGENEEERNDAGPSIRIPQPPPTRGKYRRFSSLNAKRDGKLFGKRNGLKASGNAIDAKHRDKVNYADANSDKNGRDNCEGKGLVGYKRDTESSVSIADGKWKVRVSTQQASDNYEGRDSSSYEKDHANLVKKDGDGPTDIIEALTGHLSIMDLNDICDGGQNEDVGLESKERIDRETGAPPSSSSGEVAFESIPCSPSLKSFSGKRANDSSFEKARKSGNLIEDGLSGKRIKDSMYPRPNQSEGSMFSTWMPGFWDVSEGVFALDTESLLVQESEKKSKGTSSRKIRTPNKFGGRSKCSRKKFLAPQRPMTSLESCLSAQMEGDDKRERMDDKEVSRMSSNRVFPNQPSYNGKPYDDPESGKFCGEFVTGLPSLSRKMCLYDHARKSGTRKTASGQATGGNDWEASGIVKHNKGKEPEDREWEAFLNEHMEELAHVSVEGLLYNFGVGVGMMFTIMSNKNDVRKLTSLLEEAETIIKGLEGELEGRCGSRSNSTSNEGDHEQRQSSISCTLKKVRSATSSLHDVGKALNEFDRVPDIGYLQLDDITALEAELEAELERMDMSLGHREKYIDGNCSGLSECNVEVGNLVKGELRTTGLPFEFEEDEVNEGQSESLPEEFYNGNCAVSPRELAKRLHEVIASRQEQLISELETRLKSMEIKLQEKEAELRSLKLGSLSPFQGRNSRCNDSCEGSKISSQPKKVSKIKEFSKKLSRNPFLCSGSRNASPVSPILACTTTAVSLKNSGITGPSEQNNNVFVDLGDEASADYGREASDDFAEDIRDPPKGALANVLDYSDVFIKAENQNCYADPVQSDADNVEHVDLVSLAEDFTVGYEPEFMGNMSTMSLKGRRHHPRRRNSRNKGLALQHPQPEQFLATLKGLDSSDDTTNDTSLSSPCSVKWIDTRTTGAFSKEEDYVPLPENFGLSYSHEADFYLDGLDSPDRYELPFECEDCGVPEGYSSELDDPLDKLIERIVEKSRKGSPIIQEAQIVLASFESTMD